MNTKELLMQFFSGEFNIYLIRTTEFLLHARNHAEASVNLAGEFIY
jgi:hypothetical protein